jgi:acyl carrier protein phosphodiesterase
MNFLAHAYLSGEKPKILAGNLIADFVKGKQALQSFEFEIAKGIELHRLIDAFTDAHAVVTESKKRLRPKYRHYSGVIVDVFYDHFLATNWDRYHEQSLEDFASHIYKTMGAFDKIVPAGFKHMFPYMIKGNWLLNYARIEGIERALGGMSARTPYESKMDEAVYDLRLHYDLFKKEFEDFFPDLRAVCSRWLIENTQARA